MYDRPPFRIWFERAIPSLYEPMLEGVATFRLYVWDFQAAGRLCSRESGPHGVQVLWFAHRVQSEIAFDGVRDVEDIDGRYLHPERPRPAGQFSGAGPKTEQKQISVYQLRPEGVIKRALLHL